MHRSKSAACFGAFARGSIRTNGGCPRVVTSRRQVIEAAYLCLVCDLLPATIDACMSPSCDGLGSRAGNHLLPASAGSGLVSASTRAERFAVCRCSFGVKPERSDLYRRRRSRHGGGHGQPYPLAHGWRRRNHEGTARPLSVRDPSSRGVILADSYQCTAELRLVIKRGISARV